MKAIHLTPQQRNDISDRRRHTQDRRIYQRLSAALWSDDGRSREEIAELVGVSTRQVGQWFRIFRNKGLDRLCTLHYQGDPGRLRPAQVARLKQEIATGVFHNAEQVRTWVREALGVDYSISGIKGLLRRIGASYHKVSGSFWKADVEEPKKFVLNILGAYSPDDHDYVDLRLTKEDITGEQFVKLLEALRAKHPDTEKFIAYLDNARYYSKPCVKQWLAAHREFLLVPLPAYSPNLDLIERLWKFLRKKALSRWHKTFEAMQAAVAEVLDRLGEYRDESATPMTERFAIVEVEQAPA